MTLWGGSLGWISGAEVWGDSLGLLSGVALWGGSLGWLSGAALWVDLWAGSLQELAVCCGKEQIVPPVLALVT